MGGVSSKLDVMDDKIIIPSAKVAAVGESNIIEMFPSDPNVFFDAPDIELNYDVAIVLMSGGKDSLAALKILLDKGFPKERIELHHHLVDGREGSTLFDWSFMESYNKKIAEALDLPLYHSWLVNGIEGEILKNNSVSHPYRYESPFDGVVDVPRTSLAKPGTRLKFPQQSASLTTRWCSSALKIDAGRRFVSGQERFIGRRVLIVSGERRAESSSRSRLNQLEPHATDNDRRVRKGGAKSRRPRYVDSWRPVLGFSEEQVWQTLADWRVIAPVPYRLGWSRSSCKQCIFSSDVILATINEYWPDSLQPINDYEIQFDHAISRSGKTVLERARSAKPMECDDIEALKQSMRSEYTLPVFLDNKSTWILPKGAFSTESSGAT